MLFTLSRKRVTLHGSIHIRPSVGLIATVGPRIALVQERPEVIFFKYVVYHTQEAGHINSSHVRKSKYNQ